MTFLPVEVGDSWNYLTYSVGDQKLDEKRGGRATVRWPDGVVEEVQFVHTSRVFVYTDHGHSAETVQHRLSVPVDVHGVWVWISLTELEVGEWSQP